MGAKVGSSIRASSGLSAEVELAVVAVGVLFRDGGGGGRGGE